MRTYADRVHHAADRHRTYHPTSARALVDRDDLLWVGTYWPATRAIELGHSEPLESWLQEADPAHAFPNLDAELRVTDPPRP